MPPPGSLPQSNSGQNNDGFKEPYYSNDDIGILHDIVIQAQELLPKLPERERLPTNALFNAYYEILPSLGIDADHDSRYARVLFKIGGQRGQATLYEKFQRILSRMGIEIEYDVHDIDEDAYSQLEGSRNAQDTEASPETRPREEIQEPRGRQRRNSESTAWDLGNEQLSRPRTRPSSLSSVSRIQPDPNLQQASSPEQPQVLPRGQQPTLSTQVEDSPRRNVRTWLNARSDRPRSSRDRSVSTHGSIQIRRRLPSGPNDHLAFRTGQHFPGSDEYRAPSETTVVTTNYDYDTTGESEVPHPGDIPIPFEDSEPPIHAFPSIEPDWLTRFVARRLLRKWRLRTKRLQEDNYGLENIALKRDRKALFRSGFDLWRARLLIKRHAAEAERQQVAETEMFFDDLEQRASKAREVYLMHVAFTHWANFTNEHIERTALARRHLIRTRIFNAWRDITAVNELKVRKHILKKFFWVWKDKQDNILTDHTTALLKYEENLIEKIYRKWVQRIWEVKARNWRVELDARRALSRLKERSRDLREMNQIGEEARLFCLKTYGWKPWKDETDARIRQSQQSEAKYQDSLRRSQLRKWRRETQVIPAQKTLQTDVATRRLRCSFDIWRFRTRQSREAAAIDRIKILHEAFIKWRHKTRGQITVVRIDRRVLIRSIYMWTLAQRGLALRQDLDKRRFRGILQAWAYKSRTTREQRWQQEDTAQSFVDNRTQNLVLRRWYSSMESRQRNHVIAVDYHTPRLVQKVFSQWSAKAKQRSQLQKWARDAEFYTLTSKSLKKWRASTESALRERRRSAFSRVKRMVKVNLVTSVLRNWQQKIRRILDLETQALEVRRNQSVIIGMNIFDRWRARTEELAELEVVWREVVLRKQFSVWRNRSNAIQALGTEAVISYQEHRQNRTLKKWSLKILQIRVQSNYAEDVCEKNAKRTFRKMFNYWHQKAIQKRPVERAPTVEREPTQFGETARAEAWSDFGEDVEEVEIDELAKELKEAQASTPIPGYLSTPSRRSERVMAVAAKFSTTPKAPLSTPFERQLRAQWSGGLLASSRRPPGRSRLGFGEGFADIEEGSREGSKEL